MAKLGSCTILESRRDGVMAPTDADSSTVIRNLRERLRSLEDVAARHAAMVREGDHRIKNSLQILASMMGLQARNEASVDARNALHAAAARVASIGRIHDALQVGAGRDVVDLGVIFAAMCISLQEMAGDPEQIAVVFDAGDKAALAPAEIAQPIVLAVNELVINALRHAFPDDRVGIVRVTVARIGTEVSVSVADNGVGLPDGYVLGHGFGMNLVRIMVDQLHGELDIKAKKGDGESGTTVAIRAPLVSG